MTLKKGGTIEKDCGDEGLNPYHRELLEIIIVTS